MLKRYKHFFDQIQQRNVLKCVITRSFISRQFCSKKLIVREPIQVIEITSDKYSSVSLVYH